MNRTKLEFVDVAGRPIDIAWQIGRLRRRVIEKRVLFWNRFVSRFFRERAGDLKALEKSFFREASALPETVAELRAMAEGASIPFNDLFRLNLTELHSFADKCTSVILPVKSSAGGGILLGHNEDWDPSRNDVFLLRVRLPWVTYAVVAYDGTLPGLSCGLNSFGLCHSVNYLLPPDRRVGIPRIFITHALTTARGIGSWLRWLKGKRRAFGQAVHLVQGNRYLGVELSARRIIRQTARLPALHTNHYLAGKRGLPSPLPSSLARFERGLELLFKAERKGRSHAIRILSDRSGHPHAIWRNADSPEDRGATLVTALINSRTLTMEVFRKNPASSDPVNLDLGSPIA